MKEGNASYIKSKYIKCVSMDEVTRANNTESVCCIITQLRKGIFWWGCVIIAHRPHKKKKLYMERLKQYVTGIIWRYYVETLTTAPLVRTHYT